MDGCTMVGAGYTKLAIAQRDLLARHFSSGPVLGERNCRATPLTSRHTGSFPTALARTMRQLGAPGRLLQPIAGFSRAPSAASLRQRLSGEPARLSRYVCPPSARPAEPIHTRKPPDYQ